MPTFISLIEPGIILNCIRVQKYTHVHVKILKQLLRQNSSATPKQDNTTVPS